MRIRYKEKIRMNITELIAYIATLIVVLVFTYIMWR
nr:MAG TPA: hypothetical protein [Caudoviricetes sp.]